LTTKSSVEGPFAPTTDELEHVGRSFETDGNARAFEQNGSCTVPLALVQPVLEVICQESTPVVPPTREMFPLGPVTVTEQFWPELWVWVPPGHAMIPKGVGNELVTWNVRCPTGQPELQTMLPLSSTPVTDWPFGHDWPARPLPGGPCGPAGPVAPVSPFGPCGPAAPCGPVVLDLGCGAGTDLLIAAQMTGPTGRVIGVDMTPAMLDRARESTRPDGIRERGAPRVLIESLSLEDASVDVVISNGVIDLVPDKDAVFDQIDRVLRPGGRLQIADIVIHTEVSADARKRIDLWTG
jgi:Methyltransferase domain